MILFWMIFPTNPMVETDRDHGDLDGVVHDRFHGELVRGVAGEEPGDRVPAATHLCQKGQPWLPWPERTLFLRLFHQSLITEYCLELVAGDRNHKHPEEDRLHDEKDRVEDPRLLQSNVLRAVCALCVPAPGHQADGVSGEDSNVYEELDEVLLVLLADTVVDPGTVMVHPLDAVLADAAVVCPRGPVHLTPCANCPVLLGCYTAPFTVAVREVNPMFGERHNPRVAEHSPGVGHEQQQDHRIEKYYMQAAPQTVSHCLKDDPADHDIVCIQHSTISHQDAEETTRILPKHHPGPL